jgi:Fur family ferric uptake transcriptional regulator
MSDQGSDYAALMHERGFRITLQRQFILEALRESKGHTTAEAVVERVQAKAAAVNRATVYRTLDFLCEQRLVVAANIGGQTVYELAGDEPHHHLVCLNCGRQEPLDHATVEPLFAQIERENGFEVHTNHLALFGMCRQCRESGKA